MSREVMQQALEALEQSVDLVGNEYTTDWRHGIPTRAAQLKALEDQWEAHKAAITALRAALEAQQEPVQPLKGWKLNHARAHESEEGVWQIGYLDEEDDSFSPIVTVDTDLYYQPDQAQPLAVAILGMLQDAHKKSAHPPAQPQGWVLVPEEPTPEMLRAGEEPVVIGFAVDNYGREVAGKAYRAMLAARPQPKEPQA